MLLHNNNNKEINMDKYLYKALEKTGEAIQWTFDFIDNNKTETIWFVLGALSILIVQFIF